MEDYFGEIDELVIRFDENGSTQEFYIGPMHTFEEYQEKPGDIRFNLHEGKISFDFDDLSDETVLENYYNFLGIFGNELRSMITLWSFASYFTDTYDEPRSVTDDNDWLYGSSFFGNGLSDEEKIDRTDRLILDCMSLGDVLDFAHIVATISKKLIKERAAFLKVKLIEREPEKTGLKKKRKRFGTMEFRKLAERDGFNCAICNTNKNLEIDHVIPFSKGGSDELSNLQLLCRSCNAQKGAKISYETEVIDTDAFFNLPDGSKKVEK